MPRNGNGVASLAGSSWSPAVPGTVIDSSAWNTDVAADLLAMLTQSVSRDGQTPITADIPFAAHKLTGVANGTLATDAATVGQIQGGASQVGTVGGTADVITLAVSPVITAYATGQTFQFTATGTNTTAVTVAVSGLAAKAIQAKTSALVAGDIVSGRTYVIRYDGTAFQLFSSYAAVIHTADISDSAVTFAKMQAITDGTLLGASGGTVVEQITIGGGLTLAGNTLTIAGQPNNILINGGMQVNQRVVTTGAADDTYINDRWNLLTQTSTVTISQLTNVTNGVPSAVRITQAQASAQRFGVEQIVESVNCINLRGSAVAFNAWVRCSASTNLKYAILEWTGTADTVTSDVVNDWTSGTYTAGNFFLAASLTVTAVGTMAVTAATATLLTTLTATLGSSTNNLVLFIWTETTQAQNVTLDVSEVQCAKGSALGDFVWPLQPQVLAACQRYYQKSFYPTVAPATGITTGAVQGPQTVGASTANNGGISYTYPVAFRANPTVTLFNTQNANAQAFNTTTATDCSSTSATGNNSYQILQVTFTSPGGSAAGNAIQFQFTAVSEL